MKKIYTLAAILFFNSIVSNAQAIDVIDPIDRGATGFELSGNDLYYASADNGTIAKIDITAVSPVIIDVITGLDEPEGILLIGNDLYIAQAGANKISKIDITAGTPTIIDVVTGLNEPTYLAVSGNDLYISEMGASKISKVDITASTPTSTTDVITGITTPLGLAMSGNNLYIVQPELNKISKIDITDNTPTTTDVVTGLSKPLLISLQGNDLYIAESDGKKISKIDITASTPTTATDVITELGSAGSLVSNETAVYFSDSSSNDIDSKISKINFASLSLDDHLNSKETYIYPNPTNDFILVSELSKNENYTIYNTSGNEVLNGTISEKGIIDVRTLTNGIYFFKINNSTPKKFIKN
ncbi:T9SS type A sorting domain-containing protein [Wenyingzhuangia aestuarii]|uniref:T9SS type A sorting domain-containing protein n=1 Tax=Wenyingzhuangia aestuarii TaxID=1647582 RepID=UPI00143AFD86|nr:T9SS type A sorting domain-containing protein [Wenyingzhuangia aestuarii]NJB82788.1 hypothetical protein [Wenyingzhuangia aestuarii]